ncbi:MAG: SGNH/GDSL hydrolase family protein [Anaerolineae bacterium]|nr:SGNH/GDSL hydrolase family protein [Anaerolineae bacterium]
MRKFARITGIVLLNIIVIAVLLEILLRLTAPILPGSAGVAARWVTTGKPFAQDWTPAWQQNRDHYWALRPNLDNVLQYGSPTVSFRLSTAELWEGGGIGFRATVPIDYEVHSVVVGDSFGMCFTERADCWVEQLAGNLGQNIVNLSQPVTGTSSHLRILRDFGQPLQPPLVIWQFFGNDFNDDYGLAVFREEIESLEDEADTVQSTEARAWTALYAVLETLITGRFSGVPDSEAAFIKPYGQPMAIITKMCCNLAAHMNYKHSI